jgi:large subunit ribosomal protein L10
MAVTRQQKEEILAKLIAEFKKAQTIAFTTNNALTVENVLTLKKELRAVDSSFMLAKKTLICKAIKEACGVDIAIDSLPGQVAVTLSRSDKVAGLAVLNKYAKEWKKEQKISFAGAYFDGKIISAEETTTLASLPSREVLLARLLGSMKGPLSAFARFIDAAKTETEKQGKTALKDITPVAAE